jgi:hypothetical protein
LAEIADCLAFEAIAIGIGLADKAGIVEGVNSLGQVEQVHFPNGALAHAKTAPKAASSACVRIAPPQAR